jgi:hypothetical protein
MTILQPFKSSPVPQYGRNRYFLFASPLNIRYLYWASSFSRIASARFCDHADVHSTRIKTNALSHGRIGCTVVLRRDRARSKLRQSKSRNYEGARRCTLRANINPLDSLQILYRIVQSANGAGRSIYHPRLEGRYS